jgi:Fe2+ transport system protein B
LLAVGVIALGGCKGKKADESKPVSNVKTDESKPTIEVKADENKPVSEVKTEAETMDTGQLRAMALTYKETIAAKKGELEKLAAQLKEIPVTELLGEKAKQLKTNVDSLTKSIDALKQRFDVYYAKLKEKSGDLSGLQL